MSKFSEEFYVKLLEELKSFCDRFDESEQTIDDISTFMNSLDILFYREYIGSAIEILDEASVLFETTKSNRGLSEIEVEELREKSQIMANAARIMVDSYIDILEDTLTHLKSDKET